MTLGETQAKQTAVQLIMAFGSLLSVNYDDENKNTVLAKTMASTAVYYIRSYATNGLPPIAYQEENQYWDDVDKEIQKL